MNITNITTKAGAARRRKRVGRGEGSGRGKTSGRGHKGAGARSGASKETLAEGGMFPLFRRLPKFGFNNALFRVEYQIVNVGDLEARFEDGAHVTGASLAEVGLIRDHADRIKILGNGDLKRKLIVEAQRFSASAASKIDACGGTVTRLGPQPKKRFVKRRELVPKLDPEEKKAKKAEKKAALKAAKKKGGKKGDKKGEKKKGDQKVGEKKQGVKKKGDKKKGEKKK